MSDRFETGAAVWVTYSRRPPRVGTVVRDRGRPTVQVRIPMTIGSGAFPLDLNFIQNISRERLALCEAVP